MTIPMPFNEVDYDEQIERMNELVADALAVWGFTDTVSDLAGYTNNAVYKVVDADSIYALRVHRPGLKQPEWIESEMVWLSAIHQETSLRVPMPIKGVFMGDLEGVDEEVPCVLFSWVEGAALKPGELSLAQIRQIGEFAARLHHHSILYAPSDDFVRPRLDWEGLFGESSPYRSEQEASFFKSEHLDVIERITEQVQNVMNTLDADMDTFGLIHGDLIAKNILFDGDDIGVIDFDDCAFGYYLYDLSPMLWVSRDLPNYPAIREALWEGYNTHQPLPESYRGYLETFVAARHVASCRWIAGNADHPMLRGQAAQIIDQRVDEMRHFLATGKLFTEKDEKD